MSNLFISFANKTIYTVYGVVALCFLTSHNSCHTENTISTTVGEVNHTSHNTNSNQAGNRDTFTNDSQQEEGGIAEVGENSSRKLSAKDFLLQHINKIHKYKSRCPINKCNHDEQENTNEELDPMYQFSHAMLKATNTLRQNPKYFLTKIKKMRDFIANNLDPKNHFKYVKKVINTIKADGTRLSTKILEEIKEGLYVIDEAIGVLEKLVKDKKKIPKVNICKTLVKSSLVHVKALSKHGSWGHTGVCWPVDYDRELSDTGITDDSDDVAWTPNFRSVSNRVSLFYNVRGGEKVAENLHCAGLDYEDFKSIDEIAEKVVISLFIDDGVPSRGHRETLLDGNLTQLGCAIYRHNVDEEAEQDGDKYVSVMNFGNGIQE